MLVLLAVISLTEPVGHFLPYSQGVVFTFIG